MAEPIVHQLVEATMHAEGMYCRLVLLVAPSGHGKTQALTEFCKVVDSPMVNVNLELSRKMLELSARQRTLRLPMLFSEILQTYPSDIVALDNLEILFDKGLKQDPFRLLQNASRNRTLVATWTGQLLGKKLTYADIGHPEHRNYEPDGVQIVKLGGNAVHHADATR